MICRDGARDGDSLLFAARKLRTALFELFLFDADKREHFFGSSTLITLVFRKLERKLHVFYGGELWEQIITLKDHAYMLAAEFVAIESVIFSFFYSSPFSFLLLLSPFLFFSNEKKKEISFSFSNAFSFVREEKKRKKIFFQYLFPF
jgi:hypothetical protein